MNWRRRIRQSRLSLISLLLFLASAVAVGAAEQPGLGRYHALVIGNRHHQHLEELAAAEADAKAVARILTERYGVATELLADAGREQIMRALARLHERVGSQDSLLIYYAGHGHADRSSGAGYWLPTDARLDRGEGWIPTALISSILKTVPARHVLVVSGSCYSSRLLPAEGQSGRQPLELLAERPSFTVLSAGCGGPQPQSATGHSLFAWALLRLLHENQSVLPGNALAARMGQELGQPLQYGHVSGEEGDFLFAPTPLRQQMADGQAAQDDAPTAEVPMPPPPPAGKKKAALKLTARPEPGDVMINSLTGMELVYVPSGCFTMGAGAKELSRFVWELPAHEVCVDGFWMGKHEVTQAQWEAVMGGNPAGHQRSGRHPVENVSWDDIQLFLAQLNSRSSGQYRLPTEAEWEYACRAGGSGLHCGGDAIDDLAWHEGNSGGRSHAVGELRANAFGLHDMSGNVWEWCADRFDHNYYKVSVRYNPQGPTEGDKRVVRGGSLGSKAQNCRAAFRFRNQPDYREDWLGFRIILQ